MNGITKDSVDVTVEVFAVDDISGLPKTGLTHSDITARYVRTRSSAVVITPVSLGAPDSSHSDGGFIEIEATNCRGWYRFDVPDAAFADGADFVTVMLQAEGALISPVRAQLVEATDDLHSEVHLCKAALVNKRVHTISTGVDEIKDDDGATTLVTMTPSDGGDDVIIVTPS